MHDMGIVSLPTGRHGCTSGRTQDRAASRRQFHDLDTAAALITESEEQMPGPEPVVARTGKIRAKKAPMPTTCNERSREPRRPDRRRFPAAPRTDTQYRELLAGVPNLPACVGACGEIRGRQSRRCGRSASRAPSISNLKAHWDLGPELGHTPMFDRATKITGARFAEHFGWAHETETALINFMLDTHTREHGYIEVLPPFMVNSASLYGRASCPSSREDLFKLENIRLLADPDGAEAPVTNLFSDETLDAEKLPINFCAYTPCFRSEAGSYGRDVQRDHSTAPVRESRAGESSPAPRRAATTSSTWLDGDECGGYPACGWSCRYRHGCVVHRRHGVRIGEDLRHRSLGCGARTGTKSFLLLERLRGFSRRAARTSEKERQEIGIRPYPESGAGLAVGRDMGRNRRRTTSSAMAAWWCPAPAPYLNA